MIALPKIGIHSQGLLLTEDIRYRGTIFWAQLTSTKLAQLQRESKSKYQVLKGKAPILRHNGIRIMVAGRDGSKGVRQRNVIISEEPNAWTIKY